MESLESVTYDPETDTVTVVTEEGRETLTVEGDVFRRLEGAQFNTTVWLAKRRGGAVVAYDTPR